MPTPHLRPVPDDVAVRLEARASRAGLPLRTSALQGLSKSALRADNAERLSSLASSALDRDSILEALQQIRRDS